MAHCSAETRDAFFIDLRLAEETSITSVTPKRAQTKDTHWRIWEAYCTSLGIDKYFRGVGQQLPILQVFASRLRSGQISPSGIALRVGSVCDYVSTAGEEISRMGPENRDPRYGVGGKIHVVLRQQYKSYSNDDPPPERVKPIPLQLLQHVVNRLQKGEYARALADLLIIGFFFLLRPGEYCHNSDGDNDPFRLEDVSFDVDGCAVNAVAIDIDLIDPSPKVHMRFTTQKNGVRDEDITHGDTDDPLFSPKAAVGRRVKHLRANNAPPDTPLHTVYADGKIHTISSKVLTAELRKGVKQIGKSLNLAVNEVTARALRAGGCMALFRANISATNIKLCGRWRSWAMLDYLHSTGTDTTPFAQQMLNCGTFTLNKHQPYPLPEDAITILEPYILAEDAAAA